MEFAYIEPGEFVMGSPEDEQGRYDNETPHRVAPAQGYYIQTTQVTQAQWENVTGGNPSNFRGGDLPVETVSWTDVREFIKKINEKGGEKYRLPSEAEWEYACRAGSDEAYCFGRENGLLDEYAWYDANSAGKTHPVGQKKPNAWGLYDMHGNVWEWCEDDWHGTYEGAPSDGSARVENPRGTARILRGGSWDNYSFGCRSANRGWNQSNNRVKTVGFRLVRIGCN